MLSGPERLGEIALGQQVKNNRKEKTMGENKKGMYCSRRFAEWMICKNKRDLDYPAISYYKLVRTFCRTNYNEFFAEEERKGNEFVYDLILNGNRIKFKSSYEIVFLPYEGGVKGDCDGQMETDTFEPANRFLLGYRILQTRGCMPGSTEEVFRYYDYYSMKYLVDEILNRAKEIEQFANRRELSLDHILKIGVEFGADAVGGTGLGFNYISEQIRLDDVYRARNSKRLKKEALLTMSSHFPRVRNARTRSYAAKCTHV